MNIVLPVHHFPPQHSLGAELYSLRLARWLMQHGHHVEVVCVERIDTGASGAIAARRDVYEGVPVWRLALNLRQAPDSLRWSYDNPLIGAWFADYLARTRPQLIHMQSGYLITASVLDAARALGVPSVITLHDFWFLCPRITLLRGDGQICHAIPEDPAACGWCMQLERRRYRLADRVTGGWLGKTSVALGMREAREAIARRRAHLQRALGDAAAVIAPSQFLAGMFRDLIDAAKLHVLPLGIDTQRLAATPAAADDGALRLGYIGQISPHKGVHVLVQAMHMLPKYGRPVELAIHGDLEKYPRYTRQLQQQAASNPQIRLHGRFEHARLSDVLSSCHALVVPSLWFENSPLAILEAHAAGRPVLASALGGMAELVRDQINGLHFQPGDAADLARQIQRLREDAALLPRLRRGISAPPTVDDELRALLQIYQAAITPQALTPLEVG